jgi:hypothetical protein
VAIIRLGCSAAVGSDPRSVRRDDQFRGGTVKRAPRFLRSIGFVWLWRIKAWFLADRKALARRLLTSVLRLAFTAGRRERADLAFLSMR